MSDQTTLRRGGKGHLVRWLQQQLVPYYRGAPGARYHELPVDGDFGGETARAVRAFQRHHGLPETGVFGDAEWAVLEDRPDDIGYLGSPEQVPELAETPFLLVEGPTIHEGQVFIKVRNCSATTVPRGTPVLSQAAVFDFRTQVMVLMEAARDDVAVWSDIGPGEEFWHEWPLPALADGTYRLEVLVAGGYSTRVDFTVSSGTASTEEGLPERDDADEPALAIGATGPWVTYLQELLAEHVEIPTTGTFDTDTQAALEEYQRTHHLDVTGATDARTWGALRERLVVGGFVGADPYDDVLLVFDDWPAWGVFGLLDGRLRNGGPAPIAAGTRLAELRVTRDGEVVDSWPVFTEDGIPPAATCDIPPPLLLGDGLPPGDYLLEIELVSSLHHSLPFRVSEDRTVVVQ